MCEKHYISIYSVLQGSLMQYMYIGYLHCLSLRKGIKIEIQGHPDSILVLKDNILTISSLMLSFSTAGHDTAYNYSLRSNLVIMANQEDVKLPLHKMYMFALG